VLGNVIGYSRFFVYIPFLHIDFVNLIIYKQVVLAAIISLMYFLSCSLISLQCFKKRVGEINVDLCAFQYQI
ncbi:MAG: hypothetical protein ACLTTH_00005, partial [Holdemanella porci]